MATKKCPKCGEENPAEAVMCWACYTPLSSGPAVGAPGAAVRAVAPGAAGAGVMGRAAAAPAAPAHAEGEGEKKKLDPKIIGLVAFLIVGGGIAAVVNGGLGGGSGEEDGGDLPADPKTSTTTTTSSSSPVVSSPSVSAPGPSVGPSLPGGSAPMPDVKMPYTVATAPNVKYATGVIGIVASEQNISAAQAGGLAKYAKDQYARQGKWQRMQIAVFSDAQSAKAFTTYQAKRGGAPLSKTDYQALASSGVWSATPAFYESVGKSEKVFAPSQSPTNWWASS